MAREEADRENLLAEATAYKQRIEWQVPGWEDPVFVGFRADGAVSFYFGAAPVYHFNAAGEVRRAFVDGELFKAENAKLIRLHRERTANEVLLRSQELPANETQAFAQQVLRDLHKLDRALRTGLARVQGQVPMDELIEPRVLAFLADCREIRWSHTARAGG